MSSRNATIAPVRPERPLTPAELEGDLVQPGHPLFGIVWVNPQRLSGTPCFAGTRVPVRNLFDYVTAGESIDEFLAGFPGVTREQAVAVLELAAAGLLDPLAGG
jgi:uncharacterized protein (DUF433 family)